MQKFDRVVRVEQGKTFGVSVMGFVAEIRESILNGVSTRIRVVDSLSDIDNFRAGWWYDQYEIRLSDTGTTLLGYVIVREDKFVNYGDDGRGDHVYISSDPMIFTESMADEIYLKWNHLDWVRDSTIKPVYLGDE